VAWKSEKFGADRSIVRGEASGLRRWVMRARGIQGKVVLDMKSKWAISAVIGFVLLLADQGVKERERAVSTRRVSVRSGFLEKTRGPERAAVMYDG
jgi:hypothetical protein